MAFRRFREREDGAILVEFAIVIPILLLVVWAIIDFARAYYTINSLATAVREGARVAAVQQCPGSPDTQANIIKPRVQAAFNAFGGPALGAGQIFIEPSGVCGPDDGLITVEVRDYEWLTTTPINLISGGKILMTRRAHFRWERFDS
jgi:hypothetical protein